jgi:beta-glucuronidase
VAVLRDDAGMFGYCYTQLTDTFQEQNGLYDFDRHPKFDMSRVRAVQTAPAAYESRLRE